MGIISGEQLNKLKTNMVPLHNGEGREGEVFRYQNLAVKFFKYPVYKHQEDGYDFLIGLKANRFVLIKDKIYENSTMTGFTMDYVADKKEQLSNVNMSSLMSDLHLLKEDLLMFRENKVYLTDIHIRNIMFDGNLYIIDTNSYMPLSVYTELEDKTLTDDQMKNIIYQENLQMVNEGLLEFLSVRLNSLYFNAREKSNFYDLMQKLVSNNYIGDFLKEDTKGCSTWEDYAKKKLYTK